MRRGSAKEEMKDSVTVASNGICPVLVRNRRKKKKKKHLTYIA
jgi:hypothetical protein